MANQYSGSAHGAAITLRREQRIALPIAGLLFALHPLHVESVAWIAERKDILCAFFYIATLILYINYATSSPGRGKKLMYSISLVCCIFALMSKPMAVTIPLVLVLLDFYPLSRISHDNTFPRNPTVVLDKIPFLLLSLAAVIITILAQQSWGAMSSLEARSWDVRLLVASRAICFYLVKILLPTGLSPLYPYPDKISLRDPSTMCFTAFTLALLCSLMFLWRKHKYLSVIFAYYLISVLPVLGIIQVGGQAAADRYTYLPSAGIIFLMASSVARLMERFRARKEKAILHTSVIAVMTILFLTAHAVLTVLQMAHWKDSVSLWNRVISLYPHESWVAYYNRGSALQDSGDLQRAIKDYSKVIELNPFYAYGHYRRGEIRLEAGEYAAAINDLTRAIQLDHARPGFYYSRSQAYRMLGDYTKALQDANMSIRLKGNTKR